MIKFVIWHNRLFFQGSHFHDKAWGIGAVLQTSTGSGHHQWGRWPCPSSPKCSRLAWFLYCLELGIQTVTVIILENSLKCSYLFLSSPERSQCPSYVFSNKSARGEENKPLVMIYGNNNTSLSFKNIWKQMSCPCLLSSSLWCFPFSCVTKTSKGWVSGKMCCGKSTSALI